MVISSTMIIKKINCQSLELCKGEGYWYFVYDDVPNRIFETRSVPCKYLSHMSLESWVEEGKDFVKEVIGEQS
jgi:hypothetical protein